MAKIDLICEHCGGGLVLDDTQEFGICSHCKAKTLIKSDTVINNITQDVTKHVYGHDGKDAEELVADGYRLLGLRDAKKANAKFKNAIDVEPQNWEAWFGYATTDGDRTGHLSCVPTYRHAYAVATDEKQELATFNDMLKHIPDPSFRKALLKVYKVASPKKRSEIFELVLGVIGCDESEIAALVIDLCPDDWSAWFAKAKIRQLRVRWCEPEKGLFGKKMPNNAIEVLDVFLRAYQLAKSESAEAKNIVLLYISAMTEDNTYRYFSRELNARIQREG